MLTIGEQENTLKLQSCYPIENKDAERQVINMPNKIKEYREKIQMSRSELARRLNISISHLQKVENGKRDISIRLASRIAKELECRLSDIFLP